MTTVCIIGSGAGGSSVADALTRKGHDVIVLERGKRFARTEFLKDEIVQCRRPTFWPSNAHPSISEILYTDGSWRGKPSTKYWNGTLVGGASHLMSGFFLRLKESDLKMRSRFGPVDGSEVVDWPIELDELVPYYDEVEKLAGVSGALRDMPAELTEKRSTPDFPLPPTREHPFARLVDEKCSAMGLHPLKLPRAVLSQDVGERKACDYNGYCGSYGCTTGAKGNAEESFLHRAERTGRCEVRSQAMVQKLISNAQGRVVAAEYRDADGKVERVQADVFVVACQAIETARLLLLSTGPRHPKGLGNTTGQVGRNLVSSTFGAGWGDFAYSKHGEWLRSKEPFVNRVVQDFYEIKDEKLGYRKGGSINFLLMHPNPIAGAEYQAFWDQTGPEKLPVWGAALKQKLSHYFRDVQRLKFELFCEWLTSPDCRVTLSSDTKDAWGLPVAHVREYSHPRNKETARYLLDRGVEMLTQMGAENPRTAPVWGTPSTNLMGGTCRFGNDPKTSVLNKDCRAHDCENLFVTDGSFMPSGGCAPFTFTIYANGLRVAEHIHG